MGEVEAQTRRAAGGIDRRAPPRILDEAPCLGRDVRVARQRAPDERARDEVTMSSLGWNEARAAGPFLWGEECVVRREQRRVLQRFRVHVPEMGLTLRQRVDGHG